MESQLSPQILALARAQRGVLLGSQIAGALGKTRAARLTLDGALVKMWRNAYTVPSRAADPRTRLHAAGLTLQHPATACLQTAAELYGFDLEIDGRTHIMADHDWSNATAEIVQHRYRPVRPHATIDGQQVTDLAETAVRMACRESDPAKALAVLDRALFCTEVDHLELACVAGELRIRSIALIRELIPLADGRAESPGESWLRWVCIEAGFPAATPQIWVTDEYGNRYRVDLGWADLRVGCEYEGLEFHTRGALTKDRNKYNALGRQHWLMHGVTSPMIWQTRKLLVSEIQSLLDQRGGRHAPGEFERRA